MAGDAVEVEFQQTPEDVIAFNLVVPRAPRPASTGNLFKAIKMIIIISLLLVGLHFFIPLGSGKYIVTFFAGFGVCSFYLLFMCVVGRGRQVSTAVKNMLELGENRLLFAKRKVVVKADFIEEISAYSKSQFTWKGIERVEKHQDYLYVYISTMSAILIPRRAFADEAAFEAFYQKCQAYYNAAREKPAESEAA